MAHLQLKDAQHDKKGKRKSKFDSGNGDDEETGTVRPAKKNKK